MEQENPEISWRHLTAALEHFIEQGYTYVEAPWTVPSEVTRITFDGRHDEWTTAHGDLVGSAEQSFLHLRLQNQLPAGRYVALTPCFRKEPYHDNLRRPYFMKVELMHVGKAGAFSEDDVEALAQTCHQWMQSYVGVEVDKVSTDLGYDLEIGGIEVGSYGLRQHADFEWVYGTALAEPRLSQALLTYQAKRKSAC
jgi:hypothetical protein